ncbi:hypothetical protein M8J76_004303 [Diaphorina citri]|nr:hypothetical protein M8J75_003391 [Diaphorina citri]KAI5719052.1 hypothetical protein M8J76_004303 [Diaphorina citri]
MSSKSDQNGGQMHNISSEKLDIYNIKQETLEISEDASDSNSKSPRTRHKSSPSPRGTSSPRRAGMSPRRGTPVASPRRHITTRQRIDEESPSDIRIEKDKIVIKINLKKINQKKRKKSKRKKYKKKDGRLVKSKIYSKVSVNIENNVNYSISPEPASVPALEANAETGKPDGLIRINSGVIAHKYNKYSLRNTRPSVEIGSQSSEKILEMMHQKLHLNYSNSLLANSNMVKKKQVSCTSTSQTQQPTVETHMISYVQQQQKERLFDFQNCKSIREILQQSSVDYRRQTAASPHLRYLDKFNNNFKVQCDLNESSSHAFNDDVVEVTPDETVGDEFIDINELQAFIPYETYLKHVNGERTLSGKLNDKPKPRTDTPNYIRIDKNVCEIREIPCPEQARLTETRTNPSYSSKMSHETNAVGTDRLSSDKIRSPLLRSQTKQNQTVHVTLNKSSDALDDGAKVDKPGKKLNVGRSSEMKVARSNKAEDNQVQESVVECVPVEMTSQKANSNSSGCEKSVETNVKGNVSLDKRCPKYVKDQQDNNVSGSPKTPAAPPQKPSPTKVNLRSFRKATFNRCPMYNATKNQSHGDVHNANSKPDDDIEEIVISDSPNTTVDRSSKTHHHQSISNKSETKSPSPRKSNVSTTRSQLPHEKTTEEPLDRISPIMLSQIIKNMQLEADRTKEASKKDTSPNKIERICTSEDKNDSSNKTCTSEHRKDSTNKTCTSENKNESTNNANEESNEKLTVEFKDMDSGTSLEPENTEQSLQVCKQSNSASNSTTSPVSPSKSTDLQVDKSSEPVLDHVNENDHVNETNATSLDIVVTDKDDRQAEVNPEPSQETLFEALNLFKDTIHSNHVAHSKIRHRKQNEVNNLLLELDWLDSKEQDLEAKKSKVGRPSGPLESKRKQKSEKLLKRKSISKEGSKTSSNPDLLELTNSDGNNQKLPIDEVLDLINPSKEHGTNQAISEANIESPPALVLRKSDRIRKPKDLKASADDVTADLETSESIERALEKKETEKTAQNSTSKELNDKAASSDDTKTTQNTSQSIQMVPTDDSLNFEDPPKGHEPDKHGISEKSDESSFPFMETRKSDRIRKSKEKVSDEATSASSKESESVRRDSLLETDNDETTSDVSKTIEPTGVKTGKNISKTIKSSNEPFPNDSSEMAQYISKESNSDTNSPEDSAKTGKGITKYIEPTTSTCLKDEKMARTLSKLANTNETTPTEESVKTIENTSKSKEDPRILLRPSETTSPDRSKDTTKANLENIVTIPKNSEAEANLGTIVEANVQTERRSQRVRKCVLQNVEVKATKKRNETVEDNDTIDVVIGNMDDETQKTNDMKKTKAKKGKPTEENNTINARESIVEETNGDNIDVVVVDNVKDKTKKPFGSKKTKSKKRKPDLGKKKLAKENVTELNVEETSEEVTTETKEMTKGLRKSPRGKKNETTSAVTAKVKKLKSGKLRKKNWLDKTMLKAKRKLKRNRAKAGAHNDNNSSEQGISTTKVFTLCAPAIAELKKITRRSSGSNVKAKAEALDSSTKIDLGFTGISRDSLRQSVRISVNSNVESKKGTRDKLERKNDISTNQTTEVLVATKKKRTKKKLNKIKSLRTVSKRNEKIHRMKNKNKLKKIRKVVEKEKATETMIEPNNNEITSEPMSIESNPIQPKKRGRKRKCKKHTDEQITRKSVLHNESVSEEKAPERKRRKLDLTKQDTESTKTSSKKLRKKVLLRKGKKLRACKLLNSPIMRSKLRQSVRLRRQPELRQRKRNLGNESNDETLKREKKNVEKIEKLKEEPKSKSARKAKKAKSKSGKMLRRKTYKKSKSKKQQTEECQSQSIEVNEIVTPNSITEEVTPCKSKPPSQASQAQSQELTEMVTSKSEIKTEKIEAKETLRQNRIHDIHQAIAEQILKKKHDKVNAQDKTKEDIETNKNKLVEGGKESVRKMKRGRKPKVVEEMILKMESEMNTTQNDVYDFQDEIQPVIKRFKEEPGTNEKLNKEEIPVKQNDLEKGNDWIVSPSETNTSVPEQSTKLELDVAEQNQWDIINQVATQYYNPAKATPRKHRKEPSKPDRPQNKGSLYNLIQNIKTEIKDKQIKMETTKSFPPNEENRNKALQENRKVRDKLTKEIVLDTNELTITACGTGSREDISIVETNDATGGCDDAFNAHLLNSMEIKKEQMRYYESDLKDKVVPQKCPLCERLYKSVYRMKEHMKKQHKGQLYECDCCTEYFIDRIAYEEHVRLHEGGIICRLCGEKFEKSLMRDHLVTHIPPEHRGKVSDAFFNKKQTALLTHYLKRNGIKLQCNLCADTFCPRSNMLRHYLLKHRGDKVFYACDRCDKRFSLLQNLKRHLAIHERIAYQCNVCDKKYSRLSDYKIHMNMHNGFKYQCHICLKCTSRKNYLKRHIIMMHTKFEGQIGEMEDKVGEKKIGEIEAKVGEGNQGKEGGNQTEVGETSNQGKGENQTAIGQTNCESKVGENQTREGKVGENETRVGETNGLAKVGEMSNCSS